MKIIAMAILFLFSLIYSDKANAIIFIPAVILIPIAKILALVIAGFSAPATLTGVVFSKTAKKPLKNVLITILLVGLAIAVIFGIGLKLANPDRPFF